MRIPILRFSDKVASDKEATEKFGPLKAILGAIPAACANQNVRPQLSVQITL